MLACRSSPRAFACRSCTAISKATRLRSRPRSVSARRPRRTAPCTCSRPTTPACSTVRWKRAGSRWCACRSSTPTCSTTSGGGASRPSISDARRWATENRARERAAVNPRKGGGDSIDEKEGDQEKEEEVVRPVHGGGWWPPTSYQSGGGDAPSRLCLCLNDLGDLARLETPGADAQAPGRSGDVYPHRDEVREPPSLRELVRVADRMTDRGALPADIAALRHARSLESIGVVGD